MSRFIGIVSAYAYAVSQGYTGTEEEYAELMASYASVAEEAAESAESASQSATQAGASAQTATTKASEASQSATQAGTKASQASTSATQASASATSASQSASTATTKASEASASASTASTKAGEASTSATTARSKASEASASATNAQTAQGLAESARDDAIDAKTDAESARDMAQQYAESIDPDNIFSAYPTDTASGSVATFADGANNIPMKSVVVNIEPVQSGSGDPSPDNVRPITGWTGANVSVTGVNTWDEEWELGAINTNNGVNAPSNANIRSKNHIEIKPNTSYYFVNSYNLLYYDADKAYLGYEYVGNGVKTMASNCHYVRFSCSSSYGTTYNHDISINYPSTDHDYHPYAGNTYSITFPSEAGTVYGGELDVANGVLTVDRGMVDLGSLSFTHDGTRFIANIPGMANKVGRTIQMVCSVFTCLTNGEPYDPSFDFVAYGGYEKLYIHDSQYTDTTAFTTAMNGQTLCYELATPITYTLTPTEIKSLLGDNNIWADAGNTEVTYRADPNLYIDKRIGTEAPMVATDNVVSGSYFMVGSNLYKATANIASGAAVVVGTNATAKTMAEALNEINA